MKRLLLSTTLIFGTLTGVMGSDALPDETAPSAPNVATREDVQSLVTAVTTVQTSLNAVDARTQTLQGDVATLLQRVPATPVVLTDLDQRDEEENAKIDNNRLNEIFIDIFSMSSSKEREKALTNIIKQIDDTLTSRAITEEARRSIKQTIDNFIRSVSSYTPPLVKTNSFQLWTPNFKALLTMAVILDIYLATLFYENVSKDSDLRLSVTVPMGGASTLGVCVAVLTKCFTTLKETSFPRISAFVNAGANLLAPCTTKVKKCACSLTNVCYRIKTIIISPLSSPQTTELSSHETANSIAKIQEYWGDSFKNSQSNAFLKTAISTYCAFYHFEITDSDLQKIFLSSRSYGEVIQKLQEIINLTPSPVNVTS